MSWHPNSIDRVPIPCHQLYCNNDYDNDSNEMYIWESLIITGHSKKSAFNFNYLVTKCFITSLTNNRLLMQKYGSLFSQS